MSKKSTALNCFLISSIINLAFLIFLSLYNENTRLINEHKFFVELISSSKAMIFQNHSDNEIRSNDSLGSDSANGENRNYLTYETYRSIVRETAPMIQDPNIINSLKDISKNDILHKIHA